VDRALEGLGSLRFLALSVFDGQSDPLSVVLQHQPNFTALHLHVSHYGLEPEALAPLPRFTQLQQLTLVDQVSPARSGLVEALGQCLSLTSLTLENLGDALWLPVLTAANMRPAGSVARAGGRRGCRAFRRHGGVRYQRRIYYPAAAACTDPDSVRRS